jgi:DNA polymerase epsilon subunit 1
VTAADPHAGVQQGAERSGLDLYFYSEESSRPFKSTVLYRPYFYVLPDCEGVETTTQLPMLLELIASHLVRLFESAGLYHVETVYKQDLDQPNHLSPSRTQGRPLLKLIFDNTSQLIEARNALAETIAKFRQQKRTAPSIHADGAGGTDEPSAGRWLETLENPLQCLMDLREHDVPYVVRVCTDLDIRAGTWYTVVATNTQGTDDNDNNDDDGHEHGGIQLLEPDRERKADVTFLAFDIECTKAPLKFPNAQVDEIFMISYMVSTPTGGPQGYLIVSRHVVSTDVQDFEYTPQSKYPGPFHIFNEPDEASLLKRFFAEYQRHCPQIVVTYNGDFFDWPFLQARAQIHGLDLWRETGIDSVSREGTFRGRFAVHLDAFHWVQRDSYLPQGAQGLKAVTKYKLGYDPVEVDPEDMVKFAREKPVHMATYSVSDAVATYYLYEKYVHLFIFSLSTIIPMGPEDVLCKGSGTLCEMLLMVEACRKDVLCPNKQTDPLTQFHNGHLLESETYIGGKVECLETGVYRSDIEYEFDLKPSAFQELIQNIDRDLTFAIEVEGGTSRKGIVNYDQVCEIYDEKWLAWLICNQEPNFTFVAFCADSKRNRSKTGTPSRSSKARRETIYLSPGRGRHVPQHYSHKSPATQCDCS